MAGTAAIVNQKGGVGKTTVVLGLASAAMARGHRVLVVDLDPQGASSWVLGVDHTRVDRGVSHLIRGGRGGVSGVAVPSSWSHLVNVVPASPDLQELEAVQGGFEQLLGGRKPQLRLARALNDAKAGYGIVLIDCPPSLGDLTVSALAAADEALVVVEPSALSLRGVGPVADLIETVWDDFNGELDLSGVIVNRLSGRSTDARHHLEALDRIVGKRAVWEPPIPARVVIAEAAAERQPIHHLGARARPVAEVFDTLYSKLTRRLARR
jgi:cellulose biosynthesis protein BcsQ